MPKQKFDYMNSTQNSKQTNSLIWLIWLKNINLWIRLVLTICLQSVFLAELTKTDNLIRGIRYILTNSLNILIRNETQWIRTVTNIIKNIRTDFFVCLSILGIFQHHVCHVTIDNREPRFLRQMFIHYFISLYVRSCPSLFF